MDLGYTIGREEKTLDAEICVDAEKMNLMEFERTLPNRHACL